MIWTHSLEDLDLAFTTYPNDIHPNVKVTCNHSFTPITFLDVNVSTSTAKSSLTFTQNRLTSVNIYYTLHATLHTPNEPFLSVYISDLQIGIGGRLGERVFRTEHAL